MIFDELEGAVTKDKIIELSKVEKGFVSLDQTRVNSGLLRPRNKCKIA